MPTNVMDAKITRTYVEGGESEMKELIARTPKQLDICLRLLYAERTKFFVEVEETEKKKIMYVIRISVDDEQKAYELEEKYRILIS